MKRNTYFSPAVLSLALCVVLSGCATAKEAARGFAGVSTRILEDKRGEAIRKTFAIDSDKCYVLVKEILNKKGEESYIYAEDAQKGMIAIYVSDSDTTPVGIFLSADGKGHTLVEVCGPSTYAKELISDRLFEGIAAALKPQGVAHGE